MTYSSFWTVLTGAGVVVVVVVVTGIVTILADLIAAILPAGDKG